MYSILFSVPALLISGFILKGHGAQFRFPANNSCILLDIDANFKLTRTGPSEEDASPFNIDGATLVPSQCICGSDTSSSILTLKLPQTNETLQINLKKTMKKEVNMAVSFRLEPSIHFENVTDANLNINSIEDLPVGTRNMSYKCDSEEAIMLRNNPGDPGYTMTMTLTNFKAQGYDVVDGDFSPEVACDGDKDTTTPIPTTQTTQGMETTVTTPEAGTTEPLTTETPNTEPSIITIPTESSTTESSSTATPSNEPTAKTQTTITAVTLEPVTENTTSSLEPGNMTTETSTVETTTITEPNTTPMPTPKYEVKDGAKVCIVIQGTIEFDIEYKKNGTEQPAHTRIIVPANASTSESKCNLGDTNTTQQFKVTFFDGWSFSVDITEDKEFADYNGINESPSSYSWSQIQLEYVLDDHFDAPEEPGKKITSAKKEPNGDFKASPQGSYKCSSGESLEMPEGVRLTLGNFQYRAFGTSNSSDFSGNDIANCPADNGGDDDDDKDTLAIVLGSVFGGLGLIVLVVVIVILIRKRRSKYEVLE